MDVLSEVLHAVRLTGAIYFDVRPRAPWVAESPAVSHICAQVMPEHQHVIGFHIMLDGSCWAQLADESEPPIRMDAGDAILIPRGDAHFMGSERGQRSKPPALDVYYRPDDRPLPFVVSELGGQGEPARFVCGYLGCDAQPFNPLLEVLPRQVLAKNRAGQRNMIVELIRMALEESEDRRQGGETMLAKLSELMFVEALRHYIDELPPDSEGWLSGLRDSYIGAALKLIHARPEENWSLERLAREVNLSRSAFTERFSHYVHEPPMRYLTRWRMQLALRLLESPGTTIGQAAERVGYHSEAAFNRAFKKCVGVPPGQWRRIHARDPEQADEM